MTTRPGRLDESPAATDGGTGHATIAIDVYPVSDTHERRSKDPVPSLSRELNEACTAAVTPHQIAALLEAEGLNDRLVAERYGRPGVFPLANELYESVPLRRTEAHASPPEDELAAQTGGSAFWKLIRGPIYLAPLAFFIAVGPVLHTAGLLLAGLLALVLAWAWNQGFGALTHRLLGRGDVAGAHRMARRSLLVGIAVVSLVSGGVSALIHGPDAGAVAFAAGQAGYLAASATLIVFGRDKLLIVALAPGLLVVLASIAIGAVGSGIVVIMTVATPIVLFGAALYVTSDEKRGAFPHVTPHDRAIAVNQVVLGFLWAVAIGLSALAVAGTDAVLEIISVAAAGMVLTMGVAEWRLSALRSAVRFAMIGNLQQRSFARAARRETLKSLAILTVSVVAVTLVVAMFAAIVGVLSVESAVLMVGFGFLSIAFYAGLMLTSMNNFTLPIAGSAAFLLEIGVLLAITHVSTAMSSLFFTLGCAALAVLFVSAALSMVANPVVHR